jgi:hypothetical protein
MTAFDASLLTATDFIGVRASLVAALGGDAMKAVVLTRIYYRADARWREAHEVEPGEWWWRASYQTIAEETGLSAKQVERSVKSLVDSGWLLAEAFHLEGRYDQTRSYRLPISGDKLPDSGDDIPNPGNVESPDSGNVPLLQTEKKNTTARARTTTPMSPMVEGWTPTRADVEWGLEKGYTVEHMKAETERFVNHFIANGKTMKIWGRAWRNWMTNRFTGGQGSTGPAAPAGPRSPRPGGPMPADRTAEIQAMGRRLQAQADAAEAGEVNW